MATTPCGLDIIGIKQRINYPSIIKNKNYIYQFHGTLDVLWIPLTQIICIKIVSPYKVQTIANSIQNLLIEYNFEHSKLRRYNEIYLSLSGQLWCGPGWLNLVTNKLLLEHSATTKSWKCHSWRLGRPWWSYCSAWWCPPWTSTLTSVSSWGWWPGQVQIHIWLAVSIVSGLTIKIFKQLYILVPLFMKLMKS